MELRTCKRKPDISCDWFDDQTSHFGGVFVILIVFCHFSSVFSPLRSVFFFNCSIWRWQGRRCLQCAYRTWIQLLWQGIRHLWYHWVSYTRQERKQSEVIGGTTVNSGRPRLVSGSLLKSFVASFILSNLVFVLPQYGKGCVALAVDLNLTINHRKRPHSLPQGRKSSHMKGRQCSS